MTGAEVSVTGIGLYTPAGDGAAATWERVCEGTPTAELWDEGSDSAYLACRVPEFDEARLGAARFRRPDRCTQLALLAAAEAVRDAGWDPRGAGGPAGADGADADPRCDWGGARVAVVIGTGAAGAHTQELQHRALVEQGSGRMSPFAVPSALSNSLAAQVSIALGAEGPSFTVNTACAAGATAVGTAMDLLRMGRCDVAVAGGADSALIPFFLQGFARIKALSRHFEAPGIASRPFDAGRDGFVIGEGAGMLVLERTEDVAARGARARARLSGYGAASDAHHPVQPRKDGRGITAATAEALAQAGASAQEVDYVNAHATGTPLGDSVEAQALARLLPHRPLVSSTKGVTGHLLGAAGAVEAAFTALTLERDTVPPTANLTEPSPGIELNLPVQARRHKSGLALSVSAGFGGHNAVLALTPA